MTPVEAAFLAGMLARDKGAGDTTNPHRGHDDLRQAWHLGWHSRRGSRGKSKAWVLDGRAELGLTRKVCQRLRGIISNKRRSGKTILARQSLEMKVERLQRERDEAKQDNQTLRASIRALRHELAELKRLEPSRGDIRAIASRLAA